jgi:hypothetical protein
MLRREQGWAYDDPGKDLWSKETNISGRILYVAYVVVNVTANIALGIVTMLQGFGSNLYRQTSGEVS